MEAGYIAVPVINKQTLPNALITRKQSVVANHARKIKKCISLQ